MHYLQCAVKALDETCLVSKEDLRNRTKEGMNKLKHTGKKFTSVIFGWDNVEDGTVVPNWDEQDLIDYMRHLYMKGDRTASWIARKMNNDDITGKKGGKWLSNGVLRTIRNTYHTNRNKYPKPDWWGDSYYHDVNWV
tara:strand:+ start:440 stop:850 length:411 start_codon:yes stop_codon:yes gene_type:complete